MKQKNIGMKVFIAELFLSIGTCAFGYASYLLTDVMKLEVMVASTIMTVASIFAFFCNIFGGAMITNTKNKNGRYRPWLIGLYAIVIISIFLMTFEYSNPAVAIVVAGIAYIGTTGATNLAMTPKYGLYAVIGGDDNDLRNDINGKSWAAFSVAQAVSGFALLPLVYFIAGTNSEAVGWRWSHALLSVLAVVGLLILWKIGKAGDPDNRNMDAQYKEEPIKLGALLKSVVTNRAALAISLADILRQTGTMLMFTLMFYQAMYVVGDYMAMTVASALMAVGALVGGMVAPAVIKKLGGRKRTAIISCVVSAGVYALFVVWGKSYWGYVILYTVASFTSSFVDTINPMLYMDAGEYWLDKTGEDTRPFMMSMQSIVSSVGAALSGVLFGVALTMCNYNESIFVLEGQDANVMTAWLGLSMTVGYLLYVAVLILMHNVKDQEMEEIVARNNAAGFGMEEGF